MRGASSISSVNSVRHGLAGRYALLYQQTPGSEHDLDSLRCLGISRRRTCATGCPAPNVLLNLAYSIHPPFLLEFERRLFCDLDPSEIFLLDDQARPWPGASSRILDHRAQRGSRAIAGCRNRLSPGALFIRWSTPNFCRQSPIRARPGSPPSANAHWGGSVEVNWRVPDLSKTRLCTLSRSAEPRAGSNLGTGDESRAR